MKIKVANFADVYSYLIAKQHGIVLTGPVYEAVEKLSDDDKRVALNGLARHNRAMGDMNKYREVRKLMTELNYKY